MTHQAPQEPEFPPPAPASGHPPPVGQPAETLPTQAYTPWSHRLGAYLVDSIPVAVVYGIAVGIAAATSTNTCVPNPDGSGGSCTSQFSAFGSLPIMLAWLLVLAYVIWNFGYRQGTTGSSIGKSALNFKVVSEATGQPIGFGMSFARQLVHIVDGIACYLGYLWPLWDAKRQTFADKLMSTVCMPTR